MRLYWRELHMKRFYTLLFSLTLVSSYSVAKTGKIDAKYEANKKTSSIKKSAKINSSKLVNYKVGSGDTLYSIARKHHTTVAKIALINGMEENGKLKIGKSLKVPVAIYAPLPDKKSSDIKSVSVIQKIEKEKKEAQKKKAKKTIKVASAKKISKDKIVSMKKEETKKLSSKTVISHKVIKGDSLYSIARNNHTTVDALKKINRIKSEKNLKLGQILTIPRASQKMEPSVRTVKVKTKVIEPKKIKTKKNSVTHIVKKGDSLYLIAKKNHTTAEELKKINKITSEKYLKLGQVLTIPTVSHTEKKTEIKTAEKKRKHSANEILSYKVKKGDSLYVIAKNNDTTVKALKKINKIKSEKNLKLGKVLKIPRSSHASKTEIKIAKFETKINKKTKIAKAETKKKTKIVKSQTKTKKRIASTKKPSHKKQIIDAGSSKKSILSRLSFGGKSTLKLSAAKKQLGKRYVWGATGPYTFDCSGFTSYVCKKNGVCLPRTSINQSKVGKRVSRNNLKAGDLVFFDTSKRRRGYINHVGIYMGNNKFIHASSAKKKVVISSLEKPFYKSRFKWGSRVKG